MGLGIYIFRRILSRAYYRRRKSNRIRKLLGPNHKLALTLLISVFTPIITRQLGHK